MYDIGVIPGDGIGEEVTREARRLVDAAAGTYGFGISWEPYPYGADHYLENGEVLPDPALRELAEHDALFLGAIGDPRVDTGLLERGIVGKLRFELDLYVNLRPIRVYDASLCPLDLAEAGEIDLLVIRENTEGVYTGIGGQLRKGTDQEVSMQEMVYTYHGTERIVRYGFERATERDGTLTLVDKYNAVEAHGIYRRLLAELEEEYPSVETDTAFVDAMAMWMIKNPTYFDTVVTTNMFGDIITDLGAMIQGGLGVAAGGNIFPGKRGMFEPIHGSAPKYRGKNVASPIAAILAGAMMLEFLGEPEAAEGIEEAVEAVLSRSDISSVSTSSGVSTTEMGDRVLEELSVD